MDQLTTTIESILEEFRQDALNNRDLGDKFERLVQGYLLTDPIYKAKFEDVWLWTEWPGRGKKPDTGIDLVAKERATGEFCAIQCKFYLPTYNLQKGDIDSFFTTSGKEPFTSRIIVSTTDKWSNHAEEALDHQKTPVSRLRVQDLADSAVDWSKFSLKKPGEIKLKEKKKLRDHQKEALAAVMEGFKKADRGKMIMACGTGKTFTSLKLAETMAGQKGYVLFLVPSISLINQTLHEWTAEAELSIYPIAVCSDVAVGRRKETEDIQTHDLPFPATTDPKKLVSQLRVFGGKKQLTVIFSTYQSIKVISDAQKLGAPDFDLIICDEAHRTTGVSLPDEIAKGEESYFVKVHDQGFLKGDKRLYMTATPRIYSDDSKTKAKEANAELCSMDNEDYYGKELYRLDFSEAVKRELLSDYKVMVLAVDKGYVEAKIQKMFAGADSSLDLLDDAVKITGCWNGLSKRFSQDSEGTEVDKDGGHMHRAVAFCNSIKASEKIRDLFSSIVDQFRPGHQDDEAFLTCEVEHVDGTFNALRRNEKLDWLKADTSAQGNVCRILSNARCLAEGVDVPALDAVMFLNPRNSVVDVVQSVGRVMRKAEGKKYGYIILPIGIPADTPPEEALKDNKKYKVVWQVLQALRAHDDRFKNIVNKIDLNKSRPPQIQVIGVGAGGDDQERDPSKPKQVNLPFPNIEDWRNAIFAKIVLKCGDKQYWEGWAKDVAEIAENHKTRIEGLLKGAKPKHKAAFEEFLKGLQDNINPSIKKDEAIEMLSQHLITKPVFDALFENYKFTLSNPVSLAMQKMIVILEGENLEKETEKLNKFYRSVAEKAKGVDNAEGKQKIILELYDKFFRTAFPKLSERLGIVYTPVEVVDFIVKSADVALRQEFGVGLTDKGVNILDPFTGTGTFIVRLLQNGLIKDEDLKRKFREELHANEIVLLAYYIAAINIEEAYHGVTGGKYEPFDGIVLTDTFQLSEPKTLSDEIYFPENNKRVARQKKLEIRVIVGNPPYSVGQASENEDNKNQKYPELDDRIRKTYAVNSTAGKINNLFDSYIKAFRWASDRIGEKGIVCYVSNGSFIDGNTMDGFRKSLTDEFNSIYCFDLRGKALGSGEQRKKERGNVFGGGTRTTISITLLIKNPKKKGSFKLFYHDIGDYLTKEEKLKKITDFDSIRSIPWKTLTPNASNDWINLRDPAFSKFPVLGDKDKVETNPLFINYTLGIQTNRDAWLYNFSKKALLNNVEFLIENYNTQVKKFKQSFKNIPEVSDEDIDRFVDKDPKRIKWSSSLKSYLKRMIEIEFDSKSYVQTIYRPFCKDWLYYDEYLIHRVGQTPKIFPRGKGNNLLICATGVGATTDFSALITDTLPDLEMISKSQCFPLYVYDTIEKSRHPELPGMVQKDGLVKKDGISDATLREYQKQYDSKVKKEDIFYYIYGLLNSPEYKSRFSFDLKRMLPRIPFAQDFWAFSKAGRALADIHLNYETANPYPLQESKDEFELSPKEFYRVSTMNFGKANKQVDKTTIVYNSHLTLKGIPLEAYEYVVNGRPALEWIMERYEVKKDPDSQIVNNPNDWSDDPKYIINLVKRIVTVSLETMKIVKSLPPLNEKN